MNEAPYRDAHVGGCLDATAQTRPDGTTLLTSTEELRWYPARLSDCLAQWAESAPDRTFAARRIRGGPQDGQWRRISYAEMLDRARRVGQALVAAGLSVERPLAILSGNDLEHLTLMMAATWAGVPYVSVSPAYSLLSTDHGKLRHILGRITPGMVFAADAAFGRAITATVPADTPVVLADGQLDDRSALRFDDLLRTEPGPEIDAAHAATGPDTIVKFLFTSGSTNMPKGVITTNRMLCANQQMLRQCMAFLADEPPVLVDWLPWNHTFGGNHDIGIALYNGGTFYLDDGKPTPQGIGETIRNLREISPTIYFNVPKGLEELAHAMDHDTVLRDSLFRRLHAFMFAAAGLSQAVWDKLEAHAVAATGRRVRILSGLGMTETAPSCTFIVGTHARSGLVGLPCPGVDVKLVPTGDKTEIRFRGPNVMPGYWREAALTAAAFDDEGFYRSGDAVRFADPGNLRMGLQFDGRIAEDFKLATGTFVSVGPLRAKIVALGHPCVQDAVIAGADRDEVAALIFPRLPDCAELAGLPPDADAPTVLHHPAVRAFFQQLADALWDGGTGSANRVGRIHVLAEPPSIDKGEVTDKNSINQRAVLTRRAGLVEALYAGDGADPYRILPQRKSKETQQ